MLLIKKFVTAITLTIALLFFVTASQARDVSFSWSANTDGADGYKLYYKTDSAGDYDHSVTINGINTTSYTLHNLSDDQTYHFTLTAFKTDGNLESDYADELTLGPVQTTAAPVAVFTADQLAGSSLTVAVDAGSSTGSPSSYLWDFGDGATGTGRNTSHSYSAPGEYTIRLTVQNSSGQDSTTRGIQLANDYINTVPVAIISSENVLGPAPLNATFDGSSSSDPDGDSLQYTWNFGDGTATVSGARAVHIYQAPGTYTTTLTINDGAGGIASTSTPIMVTESSGAASTASPVANITVTRGSGVGGTGFSATLDGSSSEPSAPGASIVQYAWNFGDGTTASGATVHHTYPSRHSYTVTLTVTDSLGQQALASTVLRADELTVTPSINHLMSVYKLLLLNKTETIETDDTESTNTQQTENDTNQTENNTESTPRTVITKVFGDTPDSNVPGAIEDTYININDSNNFAEPTLNTYTFPANTVANTILLKIDLSQIPANTEVLSASLKLYQIDAGGDGTYDLTAHKIINHNPVLSQCSGYTYDGSNQWSANTQSYDNIPLAQADLAAAEDSVSSDRTNGYKSWNIKQMVTDWLRNPAANYGLAINSDAVASSDSKRFFSSSDHSNAAMRPVLVVKYYQ